MRSIFRKELREILRWTPLGVIVIGLLCWQKIPGQLYGCDRVPSAIASSVIIGSGLFALALGLLQSLFDLRTDTRGFLLHRPISVRDIFWGKLAAGFVTHTLAWAIPLLLAAIYLESIGPERLPVTWSNVVVPAVCCVFSFLFHPAGMWMACREARWVGTKCLPLVLPLTACFAALAISELSFSWLELAIPVVIIAVLPWIIIAAARHAMTHQTFLPAPASGESWSWSNTLGLGTAGTVAMVTAFVVVSFLTQRQHSLDLQARRLAVSTNGELWEVEETWKSPRMRDDAPIHRTGRPITGDRADNASFHELDATWREEPAVELELAASSTLSKSEFFRYWFQSSSASKDNHGEVDIFERDGKLYLYSYVNGLVGIVTPRGIFKPDETPQGAFGNLNTLDSYREAYPSIHIFVGLGGHRLLADDSGIYQLDVDAHQLRKLSDAPARGMAITLPSEEQPNALLWTRDAQTARRFSIRPLTENQTLPSIDSELVKATRSYPLSNVKITPDGEWSLDWIDGPDKTELSVASVSNNNAVFIANDTSPTWRYRIGQPDGAMIESGELPAVVTTASKLPYGFVPFPPALITGAIAASKIFDPDSWRTLGTPDWWWLLVTLHAIIGGFGAFLLSRSRVRSMQAQMIWLVVGLLLGVPAWLSVIAIHPRLIVEPCTACQRRRRVDSNRCEHCGADWEVPDREGIELIGPREFANAARQASV